MSAVGAYVRVDLRNRWRALLALGLGVAICGTVVLGAVAGARRTSTAFERFAAATATQDAAIQIDEERPDAILAAIERSSVVAESARGAIVPVLPGDEGLDDLDLVIYLSPDGRWGEDVDRPLVIRGRLPDADESTEVMINELTVEQTGLGVGDRIRVTTFTTDELWAAMSGQFRGFSGPDLALEVVGIGRRAIDLQGADVEVGAVLHGTKALYDEIEADAGILSGMLAVRLRDDATVGDLRAAVGEIAGDAEYEVIASTDLFGQSAADAADVLANALWAFAVVAGVASAVAIGGATSRQYAAGRSAGPLLTAMGATRSARVVALGAVPALGLIAGSLGAGAGAVLASSIFPIGIAARMEPEPGIRVDGWVVTVGTAVLVGFAVAWTVLVGARDLRRSRPSGCGGVTRLPANGLPLGPSIGIGHAFQRRADERAVPVRTALLAAVVAVAGVVGAATVVRSLDALAEDPGRYGWAWSAAPDYSTDDVDALAADVSESDVVAATAVRRTARVEIDGLVTQGTALEVIEGTIRPVVRTGAEPANVGEVALGAQTARALGVGIGDEVRARRARGGDEKVLQVVGIAVFPPIDGDPAVGALLTAEGLDAHRRSEGSESLVLRYRDGLDAGAAEESLAQDYSLAFSVYSRPRLPGTIENLQRATPVLAALGVFFAGLGTLGLGHALVVGVRRRRQEFETLRALGLQRRQLRSIVTWNAVASMLFAAALGAPLGLATGRAVWRVMVGDLGLIDAPTAPVVALGAAAPAALAAAWMLSWWPGRRVSHLAGQSVRAE